MKRIELGRTGQTVSRTALGCMLMGTRTDHQTSARILDAFLDAGGDFLDTADCYAWWTAPESTGHESEQTLGQLLKGRRDKVFLATKVSAQITDMAAAKASGDGGPYYEGAGGDLIRRRIDESLRRLNTDHVDLYYVHVDDKRTPLEETLAALDEIVKAGKVRYIGWSNVWSWRLERVQALAAQHGWTAPVAVQQQHSYLKPVVGSRSIAGEEMLDYLRDNEDMTLVAYSPILCGVYEGRRDISIWRQYAGSDAEKRLIALAKVAQELGVTSSQVVLGWLGAQTPGVVSIVGPRTWEQYEAYVPGFDLDLSPEHLALLDQ